MTEDKDSEVFCVRVPKQVKELIHKHKLQKRIKELIIEYATVSDKGFIEDKIKEHETKTLYYQQLLKRAEWEQKQKAKQELSEEEKQKQTEEQIKEMWYGKYKGHPSIQDITEMQQVFHKTGTQIIRIVTGNNEYRP